MSKANELLNRVKEAFEAKGVEFCEQYAENQILSASARNHEVNSKYICIEETCRRNGTFENVTVTISVNRFESSWSSRVMFKAKVPKDASDKVIENRVSSAMELIDDIPVVEESVEDKKEEQLTMNPAQGKAVEAFKNYALGFYGHPETKEFKECKTDVTEYGVWLSLTVGLKGDEGTLAESLCRKSYFVLIGKQGGYKGVRPRSHKMCSYPSLYQALIHSDMDSRK